MDETEGRQRPWRGRGRLIAAALILGALALGFLLLRDRLGARETYEGEPFTYDPGENQVFAAAGSGLAVASGSSVALLNGEGATVFHRVVSYSDPAVFASPGGALFCDLGSDGCILVDWRGELIPLDCPGTLITAHRSAGGWAALTTAEPGYKALVSVFDPQGILKFRWWSGSGYVLKAAVAPGGRSLGVLCAEEGGSRLHLLALDSGEALFTAAFPGELLYDFAFFGEEALCVLGDRGARFLDREGKETGVYALEDRVLTDYAFGEDFSVLCLSPYRTGGDWELVSLDRDGTVLGSLRRSEELTALSAQGDGVLALTAGGLWVFDRALEERYAREELTAARSALLLADGNVLLLGAYGAEKLETK